ncbi:MAG: response regulator transcription factor [Bacteroidota bacterium]
MPITVAIVDDHTLFRKGLHMILADFPDLQVIFEAANGRELLTRCAHQLPDVVLLDLKMPGLDGVETTRRLRAAHPTLRIILLTLHDNPRLIRQLMEMGANGYLLKNENPTVVYAAIRAVTERGYYFNDYVGRALLNGGTPAAGHPREKTDAGELPSLTPREREVLELICRQRTTREIATALFITPRTVEGHRKNLLEKTDSRNVAGLVVYAIRNGLVELP